jgi:hypothetical protein
MCYIYHSLVMLVVKIKSRNIHMRKQSNFEYRVSIQIKHRPKHKFSQLHIPNHEQLAS